MKDITLTVGVEIETSNMLDAKADELVYGDPCWGYHGDGSIPGYGVEFVSSKIPEAEIHKISGFITSVVIAGGTFPDSAPAPTCLKDCQVLCEVPQAVENYKKAKETNSYISYYKDELASARKEAREMWRRVKEGKLTLSDDLKQECCGFHVHVGIKSKKVRTNGKLKGIARAIYAFYHDQEFAPNLPLCRLEGGMAYGWCQLIRPEPTSLLRLSDEELRDEDDEDYAVGSRYQAVNVCSEFRTIEFRQGSISDSCRFTADQWVRICCDIVRGAWQLTRHRQSPETVAELYAMLPPTLEAFQRQVTKIRANPDKYLLKRAKPSKSLATFASEHCYFISSDAVSYIQTMRSIQVNVLENGLQYVNILATTS